MAVQNCPLFSPGDSLLEIQYRFPGTDPIPGKVLFTIMHGEDRLFEPRPAEQVSDRTFTFPASVPSVSPGLYTLVVIGKEPGMSCVDLIFAVQDQKEEYFYQVGGITLGVSSRLDPDFSWSTGDASNVGQVHAHA